jgi:hypothetical protein
MTEPAPWHHFILSMSFRHEAPIDKKHPHQPPFAEGLAEHANRAVRDQYQQHDENAGEGPPRQSRYLQCGGAIAVSWLADDRGPIRSDASRSVDSVGAGDRRFGAAHRG